MLRRSAAAIGGVTLGVLGLLVGAPPPAQGVEVCVYASVDAASTTVVYNDVCGPRPPANSVFPCPGGAGVYSTLGGLPGHEVHVCVKDL